MSQSDQYCTRLQTSRATAPAATGSAACARVKLAFRSDRRRARCKCGRDRLRSARLSQLLSDRVGSSGIVVGVERSAEAVALARGMVSKRGLTNVEVLERDARVTGLPRVSFDLVTSRLVLVNVPQPEQIVAEAAALVRPGGWVAFHEADYVAHICDPPLEAWTKLVELLATYSERNGIDPFIGRKLPRLLREAGLVEVHVKPFIHVYPPGHGRRSILLDFAENLSERVVAEKLIAERELTDLKIALRRHLDNPDTLVVSHLFFQAWGRKPGGKA